MGFIIGKKDFNKIINFVKNPHKFFTQNRDNEKESLGIATFLLRVSYTLSIISQSILIGFSWSSFLTFIAVFIFAPLVAMIGLAIGGFVINGAVSLFYKRKDLHSAKRILSYAAVVSVISSLGILYLSWIASLIWIALVAIGISVQYNLRVLSSLIVALIMPLLGMIITFAFIFLFS